MHDTWKRSWAVVLITLIAAVSASGQDDPENADPDHETRLREVQNSFDGPSGGIRIIDAGSGPSGTFRLALNTEFFVIRDHFVEGDRVHHFAGNLSLTITPTDYLEVFASAEVTSDWSDSNDPMLIQRVADLYLGLKGFYRVRPWITVGGDFALRFPGGVGDGRATFRATSVGLRGNATLDFREHDRRRFPLIARFNARYLFDNSANLIEGIEDERLSALGGPIPQSVETRHLLTTFERFAYGVNRVDSVRLAVGFEAPLHVRKVGLHPMLEWQWDIPVNRQGYRCPVSPNAAADGCLADEKLRAFPMLVTFGLRLLTPLRGLAFTVGADIGVTGARTFVRELAPAPPYNVILGIGYAFDPRPEPRAPARSEPRAPRKPDTGQVHGLVLDANRREPIEGAVVRVVGHDASPGVTDAAGHFVTDALPQGQVVLEVSHSAYTTARCPASVPSEIECALAPAKASGQLRVVTVDRDGNPVSGVPVNVRGPTEHRLQSDDKGLARVEAIEAGAYAAYVDQPGHLLAVRDFDIRQGTETSVTLRLLPKPTKPRVVVRKTDIVLRRQVRFASAGDEILQSSEPLLLEIADALLRNPEVRRVEIQGHTDSRGGFKQNMALSERRAQAVRGWLVEHGVDGSRLEAKGYGDTRPLLPNITAGNRARNRRVQFKILERADAAAP